MKRLSLLLATTLCGLYSSSALAQRSNLSANESKPNVLLIFTDDHRYTGVHALGGHQVQTPHLDQLSNEGLTFTNAYLMGSFSGATCIPSRAMLHTGRDLFKLKGIGRELPVEHRTIGEAFKEAGYFSYHVGKWHQDKASLSRSFDSGAALMGFGVYLTDHFRMPYQDWDPTGGFPAEDAYLLDASGNRRALTPNDKRGPTGTEADGPHSSEVFADGAVSFIDSYDRQQPFFMYLAFHAPHDPRHAPQAFKDKYPEDEIELTPSYLAQHPFDNGQLIVRDEKLAPWPRTPEMARKVLSDYYAIITHMDAQIGRVIESLKQIGQWDDTIVVMAGDSGLAVGNHGLLGKQSLYDEDGLHVPFIISGGYFAGMKKRVDAFCYIHDIFPTICDLAGIPDSVTGHSLNDVIAGREDSSRDSTYHAYMQFQRAYRKGDYKLIEYVRSPGRTNRDGDFVAGSRVTQLFNYREDPWETNNLAYFPEYEEILGSLRSGMRQAAIELEDDNEALGYSHDFWESYTN